MECNELCNELCFKKNKFKKVYYDGCEVAKISLTVTLVDENLIYTITNTGTIPLCNDFYICSKLYRKKIKIENRLLLENEFISITMPLSNLETEKARAYIKIKDKLFIYSDLVEFENTISNSFISEFIDPNATAGGVYITSNFVNNSGSFTGRINCNMTNNANSSSDATNVRFKIGYSGVFNSNVTLSHNNTNKFQFYKDSTGIYGYIPLWKRNESYSFAILFDITGMPRPIPIPLNFYLTSDNKFGEFTNYIRIDNTNSMVIF